MQNQVTFLFVFLLLPLTLLSHINYQDIKNSTDLSIATLTLSTTVADITAPGANDGSITVTPLSGTAPYTYAWSHNPSLTTGTASGLATGDYFLLVTDATGCTGVASERILEPLECDGSLFHIVKDVVNVEMDIHLVSVTSSGLVSSNLFPINY
ncbi:MAG: SprB repeat-containing protein, partial [Bacteroidota bacterium]